MKIYKTTSPFNGTQLVVIVSTQLEKDFCEVCPKRNRGILEGQDADTGEVIKVEVDTTKMECPCPPLMSRAFVQSKEMMDILIEMGKWDEIIKYVEKE